MAKNLIVNTAKKLLAGSETSLCLTRQLTLWTADKIVKSPHKDIKIPTKTIPEHIWENLERWSDKTAIVCGITNRSYNYHQLYKYSRNFAANLRNLLKIRDGDIVCMVMTNSPEYSVVLLGALEAGAIVTTVNPTYTSYEIARQIELSNTKILIGQTETIPVLKEALHLAKLNLPMITVKSTQTEINIPSGTISFEELAIRDYVDHCSLNEVSRKFDDVAILPYSSGTTGLPKGVELTHKNVVANVLQQDVDTVRHYDETTKINQDIILGVIPFYHIYGLSMLLLHKLSVGLKIVTVPQFQPNTLINVMEQYPITLIYAAPPLVLFLGSYPGITKKHLNSVKTIGTGAAPLPKNDANNIFRKVKDNIDFLNMYGMTEVSPLVTTTLPGSTDTTSVGYGIPSTELRVVDSKLQPLGANEVGELLIRGPQVMKGYRNNPQATQDVFIEDGWIRSGDLVSIDKDGVVTIADRLKELIKVKGYQVPPAELECVIKEHPDVFDVAVIGIPHPKMGEVPKAFIVLKEGRKVDAEEIKSFVDKKVANYKRVKEVTFLDSIPKNTSGKILKRVLKERHC